MHGGPGFKTTQPLIQTSPHSTNKVNWRVAHEAMVGVTEESRWLDGLKIELIGVLHNPEALLTEAALLARKFSNELPELGESQLPVVVLIERAHERVDRPGAAEVLWADYREET